MTETNAKQFGELLAKSKDQTLVVDFHATWCGPCQMFYPLWNQVAGEYSSKALFAKVDVDQEEELAMKYQIQSIPTIVVIKDGKEVLRKAGVPTKADFVKMFA